MYTCSHIHLDDWQTFCRDSETNLNRETRSGQEGKLMMLCCSPSSAKAKRWKRRVHTNLLNALPGYRGQEEVSVPLFVPNAHLTKLEHNTQRQINSFPKLCFGIISSSHSPWGHLHLSSSICLVLADTAFLNCSSWPAIFGNTRNSVNILGQFETLKSFSWKRLIMISLNSASEIKKVGVFQLERRKTKEETGKRGPNLSEPYIAFAECLGKA